VNIFNNHSGKNPQSEDKPKKMFLNWEYRPVHMTLEYYRRKDEEEIMEMFNIKKPKRVIIK